MSDPSQRISDDSDLVALRVLHIAAKERAGKKDRTDDLYADVEQHLTRFAGDETAAILELVCAMARHASLYISDHIQQAAERPDVGYCDPDGWLEHWTLHTLGTHVVVNDLTQDDGYYCSACGAGRFEELLTYVDRPYPGAWLCEDCLAAGRGEAI